MSACYSQVCFELLRLAHDHDFALSPSHESLSHDLCHMASVTFQSPSNLQNSQDLIKIWTSFWTFSFGGVELSLPEDFVALSSVSSSFFNIFSKLASISASWSAKSWIKSQNIFWAWCRVRGFNQNGRSRIEMNGPKRWSCMVQKDLMGTVCDRDIWLNQDIRNIWTSYRLFVIT